MVEIEMAPPMPVPHAASPSQLLTLKPEGTGASGSQEGGDSGCLAWDCSGFPSLGLTCTAGCCLGTSPRSSVCCWSRTSFHTFDVWVLSWPRALSYIKSDN